MDTAGSRYFIPALYRALVACASGPVRTVSGMKSTKNKPATKAQKAARALGSLGGSACWRGVSVADRADRMRVTALARWGKKRKA